MRVRGWGQRTLAQALQPEQSGVAAALLLGEGSTMTSEGWQRYIRTGAIHVLAISGQHLMILAVFLWLFLRSLGVRRRPGILAITVFVFTYALLTGGRPLPVVIRKRGHLSLDARSENLNLIAQPPERCWSWWGRVIFYVSDVDALHQRALAAGYRPTTSPRDAEWGERFFHLDDPDGHELSFARPLRP